MSERKVEVNATSQGAAASDTIDPKELRAKLKARRAEVYDRGVAGDRLHVDLPQELHGEWVPNNAMDIHRKEALGFKLDDEYAKKRALHDKGDSYSYVGDVVFMVTDRENKEILDEIRRDRYNQLHGIKKGGQVEERNYQNSASAETRPTADSKVNVARPANIADAIKAANNNQ